MKLPKIKLGKVFWGSVSIVGAGCTFAGIATVAFGDVTDTREHLQPTSQCTVTTDEWVGGAQPHFKEISFYTSWNGYDDVHDDADFRPYADPTEYEIEDAARRGEPTPQGGAEQALDDCIAYIDERDGIGLRDVRVNSGTAGEHGFNLPIPIGQHAVTSEDSQETSRYRLGNKWAAREAIGHIRDHRELVDDRRRAHNAEENLPDNSLIQVQRRVREDVTERAKQQDGSWSSWGWGLVERYVI
ncbi:MAG: hypothetical protein AB7E85_04630 [Pseudobdellovibrionaceae bacterium]